MKKYILSLLLVGSFAFAQTKPQDYSTIKNIEEVRKKCIEKDNEILRLTSEIKNLNDDKNKLSSKKNDSEVNELKELIKDINTVFLRDIFKEKYITNDKYFIDTDLVSSTEDNTQKFINSDVIIKSVKVNEIDPVFIQKCITASEFNENYLKLFAIRKDVLFQKYDSEKVNQALKDIDNLPALENNSKLFITKTKIRNYLENYLQRTCELKIKLDKLSKGNDQKNATFKQNYNMLQNKEEFKTYPYLIQVIEKVKNNINNYSKNDLQPCEEVKTTTSATEKIETVKESTTIKADEPKVGKQ